MNKITKISKKISVLILGLIIATAAVAQEEEEPSFSFSGTVDAYFHSSIGTEDVAPTSSFANLPGFALGMVNTIVSYEGEKVGFVGDLVFGPRGSDAVFGSPAYSSTGQIVNQLYVYWNVSDAVTLTLGNFNTFLGYEVISPAANFNYSTSYMFSYGPFSHTGVKADIGLSDELSLALAIMNPTDMTEANFNRFVPGISNTYTYGAQLGYSNDMGGAWLNFLVGDQDGKLDEDDPALATGDASGGSLFQVDLTTGWDISDAFYLGLNATYLTIGAGETYDGTTISDATGDPSSFMGFALYPQLALTDPTSIGLRFEYFAEGNGGVGAIGAYDTNGDGSVIDLTLSLNHKVGNLTLIPEFRVDLTSEDAYTSNDGTATSTLPTFTIAGVYAF